MNVFIVDTPALKASTETEILNLQIIMSIYGALIPLVSYYTWKYSKVRSAACIKPRRPRLTIYVEITIIFMFLSRIMNCSNAIYPRLIILRILYVLLYSIGNHSILWLCTIKYWLLYYDVNFSLSSEGNQWKVHINKNNVTHHTNWFVINISTLGNEGYLLPKVMIIILFPSIIVPLATFIRYTTRYNIFIDLLFMIIPILLTAIIWTKTPKYLDYFRVREECRMLLIIGMILVTLYVVFGCIAVFILNEDYYFIGALCIEYTYLLGIAIAALHLTLWTMLKNKHRLAHSVQEQSKIYVVYRSLQRRMSSRNVEAKKGRISTRLSMIHSNSGTGTQIMSVSNKENAAVVLLTFILENQHGFAVFLSHLLTEFCLESALAIIEFTQYQLLMKKIYGANAYELSTLKLPGPHIVPQSIIVYDPENESVKLDITHIRDIARRLLQKYVVNASHFEINISYKLKKKLLMDLDNIASLSEDKLVHLFDESIQSLLLLLNDSVTRFVKTEKFKQIEKELDQMVINAAAAANDNAEADEKKDNCKKDEHLKVKSESSYIKVQSPSITDSSAIIDMIPIATDEDDDEKTDTPLQEEHDDVVDDALFSV